MGAVGEQIEDFVGDNGAVACDAIDADDLLRVSPKPQISVSDDALNDAATQVGISPRPCDMSVGVRSNLSGDGLSECGYDRDEDDCYAHA